MQKFNTIDECINKMISQKCVKSFYTTAILKEVDNITLKDIYKVCEKYKESNKLEVIYEIRCEDCATILGQYKVINNIPTSLYCMHCGEDKEIDPLIDSNVLYKIIR